MQLLIRQAKVIDPGSGFHNKTVDILIKNGKIVSIGKVDADADKIIEAEGLHVSAGWVDILADYREPGYEQKETIASGLAAAAAGGFTEVLLAPNTSPSISTKSIVEFVISKAAGNIVSLRPLGSASAEIEGKVLAEMLDMRAHGAVAFTDGWKPIQNANLLLKALEYIKAFNGVLIQIPSDISLSAGGLMHEGKVSTRLGMAGIPEMAETLIVHRDIELLRYTGSKLHISGVSSAVSVEMIRKAKAEGLNITCSVTPYHLALTDEALTSYSSLYKVTPPLRTEADRQALIAALADGTIDCIVSHHRPQEWDAKEKEFEYAGDGMNVQEMAYNIALTAVGKKVSAGRLVDALAVKPREIFNLPVSAMAEGSAANLTLFTTAGNVTYANKDMRSLSRNNPFLGQELQGRVIGIVNNNKIHLNK
ncbi:MAG: dihydroorotase [Sphingobacteriales bacterium]|nr:MAG: dihydroorotase [Sphingobacteriales bacterium]